ncbi:MAG: ABC transporter permease [Micromonosporaceae bacterium]
MSVAELSAPVAVPRRRLGARFFASELRLIFGRRRNQVALVILCLVPLIIAFAVWWSAPEPGDGPDFFGAITENGLFVALAALTVELGLFLPLAVAAVAADAVAGEANQGTLRYLLTVPAGRGRLLLVKYAGVVTFALVAVLAIAVTGVLAGLALFGGGELTLLSGTRIGFGEALGRLLLVCLYVAACLAAVGAIGLFVSTLTEQPVGATIAVAVVVLTSHILGTIPQLEPIHEYLLSHWWFGFGDLLRDPIATESIGPGLISAASYAAIFGAAAWARFAGRDITS